MGLAHQARADRAVLGRAQPVNDVDRRRLPAVGRERLALECGAAEPQMADDLSCFVARDIAARGRWGRPLRLSALPGS